MTGRIGRAVRRRAALGLAAATLAAPTMSQAADEWVVRPEWVRAHEAFLASDALQGRGSATRDEAIAAAYVAAQFEAYGLSPAPGMRGYLQTAKVITPRLTGRPVLRVAGAPVAGLSLFSAPAAPIRGTVAVLNGGDLSAMPSADVVIVRNAPDAIGPLVRAATAKRVKLIVAGETDTTRRQWRAIGATPRLRAHLEGVAPTARAALATVPADALARLAAQAGAVAELDLPGLTEDQAVTTNAIGYLAGTNPKAGVLLFTAHLDHLGVRPDGVVMHGANDDASGTAAVLEIAHALAAGKRPRRSILFVAYGAEEAGEFGSEYFAAHPSVPLTSIVANIEFEMIGAQDPKLPAGTMMMTGFERSDLGPALKAHGALVAADPHPEENLFQRSDNYQLALEGVVAHTISGSPVVKTYHQPSDTIENLDFPLMTRAIQSLIGPARWLARGRFTPRWRAGGRPVR